jgi:hypothetical protein
MKMLSSILCLSLSAFAVAIPVFDARADISNKEFFAGARHSPS